MLIVTGANGFIGSAMIWELNQRGHQDIIAVDFVEPDQRKELLRPLRYDRFMKADEFLLKLKTDSFSSEIQCVFHMGACSSTTEMNLEYLKRVNTDYTLTLFSHAQTHQWPFIYASSGAVYGGGELGFDDKSPSHQFRPLNPYGNSKAAVDVWAESQKTLPSHWYGLRFFNVYGPNEYHKGDMSSVVYKAVEQIRRTGQLKLFKSHNPNFKDGEQLRDFVYVKDITRWMWEIYQSPKVPSGIYNLGFGQARTWLDLAKAVFKNLGASDRIDWIEIPENIRNQYQYFTEAKMQKLLDAGLSAPQWPLEKGIEDYVQRYLRESKKYLGEK